MPIYFIWPGCQPRGTDHRFTLGTHLLSCKKQGIRAKCIFFGLPQKAYGGYDVSLEIDSKPREKPPTAKNFKMLYIVPVTNPVSAQSYKSCLLIFTLHTYKI
jgi:hypothetical protein